LLRADRSVAGRGSGWMGLRTGGSADGRIYGPVGMWRNGCSFGRVHGRTDRWTPLGAGRCPARTVGGRRDRRAVGQSAVWSSRANGARSGASLVGRRCAATERGSDGSAEGRISGGAEHAIRVRVHRRVERRIDPPVGGAVGPAVFGAPERRADGSRARTTGVATHGSSAGSRDVSPDGAPGGSTALHPGGRVGGPIARTRVRRTARCVVGRARPRVALPVVRRTARASERRLDVRALVRTIPTITGQAGRRAGGTTEQRRDRAMGQRGSGAVGRRPAGSLGPSTPSTANVSAIAADTRDVRRPFAVGLARQGTLPDRRVGSTDRRRRTLPPGGAHARTRGRS